MADFTEAEYTAAIPRCCSRQTLQEHVDMMLCWGLAAAPDLLALAKQYASECSNCDGTGTYSEFYDDGSVKAVEDCEECDDIRAVIAKAEGQA